MRKYFFIFLIGILVITGCSTGKTSTSPSSQKAQKKPDIKAEMTPPATTDAQLKVEDIIEGTGEPVKNGDQLRIHYIGYLKNGTKFESSYDFGQTLSFQIGKSKVMKGWEQGLIGMKQGGKRKLTIPPELAFGNKGSGVVAPNSTVIYEIELLQVN